MKLNKRIKIVGWLLFFLLLIGLWIWASHSSRNSVCQGIKVDIEGQNKAVFIDENTIKESLKTQNIAIEGQPIDSIQLQKLERILRKNEWISSAKLFFDNNGFLTAKIQECEPAARVFTVSGRSFYVDTMMHILPDGFGMALKMPVFTSFPSDLDTLSPPDSAILKNVVNVAKFLAVDSFWNAFVTSVNIQSNKNMEVIPIIGKANIIIGNSDSLPSKFNRIYSFYKQVLPKTGYSKYEKIDVRFDNQVVGTLVGGSAAQVKALNAPAVDAVPLVLKANNTVLPDEKDAPKKDSATSKPVGIVKKPSKVNTKLTKNTVAKPLVKTAAHSKKIVKKTIAKTKSVAKPKALLQPKKNKK